MRGRPPRRYCAWAPRHSNGSRHARRNARGRGVVGDPSSPWWGSRPARQRRESIPTARDSLWMSNRRYLRLGILANRVSLILVQIIFCYQPSIVQPSPVPNTIYHASFAGTYLWVSEFWAYLGDFHRRYGERKFGQPYCSFANHQVLDCS